MAMSDCVKCWDTPCTCGYAECALSMVQLKKKIMQLNMIMNIKESIWPNASQDAAYKILTEKPEG